MRIKGFIDEKALKLAFTYLITKALKDNNIGGFGIESELINSIEVVYGELRRFGLAPKDWKKMVGYCENCGNVADHCRCCPTCGRLPELCDCVCSGCGKCWRECQGTCKEV